MLLKPEPSGCLKAEPNLGVLRQFVAQPGAFGQLAAHHHALLQQQAAAVVAGGAGEAGAAGGPAVVGGESGGGLVGGVKCFGVGDVGGGEGYSTLHGGWDVKYRKLERRGDLGGVGQMMDGVARMMWINVLRMGLEGVCIVCVCA